MNKIIFPNNEGLQTFVDRLEKAHYYEISALCDVAKKQALKLQELEAHQSTSYYVTMCIALTDEVKHYISVKRSYFIPYVHSLFNKVTEGHDCSNCTGNGCSLQHDIQLEELKQSHIQLKDILSRLQMVSLPLYSDTIYPDVYRVLRNNMALLENSLGACPIGLPKLFKPGQL